MLPRHTRVIKRRGKGACNAPLKTAWGYREKVKPAVSRVCGTAAPGCDFGSDRRGRRSHTEKNTTEGGCDFGSDRRGRRYHTEENTAEGGCATNVHLRLWRCPAAPSGNRRQTWCSAHNNQKLGGTRTKQPSSPHVRTTTPAFAPSSTVPSFSTWTPFMKTVSMPSGALPVSLRVLLSLMAFQSKTVISAARPLHR